MKSLRYLVRGAVQGVGFRPFVYREATARQLDGWVKNTPEGVEILVRGNEYQIADFEAELRYAPPPRAKIIAIEASDAAGLEIPIGFCIQDSTLEGASLAQIMPDIATCPDCLREMNDPSNRRYRYPFTNCTNCGPRYSIMLGLPYDRERTTMRSFTMCADCRAEFEHPADRRFHAQPNACPVCGPRVALWDHAGRTIGDIHDAITRAAAMIREGRIIAVKGIGGFHLLCDATNEASVRELRRRKHREEKPFALLVPDLEHATRLAQVGDIEAMSLQSPAAPVVLIKRFNDSPVTEAVAPGNPWLGLFLPYSPLHHILMQEINGPVVATSGNFSDEPICTDEREALEKLGGIADAFLVHDRPIAHPVDDSVMRVVLGQPLILRAGRGLAPITLPAPPVENPVLGVGPHMKTTVAVRHRDQIVVSPHIGDIATVASEAAFGGTVELLEQLLEVKPLTIACDRHPDHATTRYALRRNPNPIQVQHHHAHVLAVMAEHGLRGPVLGVAWDGTGYGDDGTIWGGEFLRVDESGYERVAHLRTFPLPGGDAAAREPRRSALGVLHELGLVPEGLDFTPAELATLTQVIKKGINTVQTSSAGRLFDAAAALLGLCQKSAYEGHAAMLLQAAAEQSDESDGADDACAKATRPVLDWAPLMHDLLASKKRGDPAPRIAARFHYGLAQLIGAGASLEPELPVVLCGGCFQNSRLLAGAVQKLQSTGREVYWPHILPPNDGAISAGQVMAIV